MKKSELKSIIKECVKEILFQEGVLSDLVAEVAFGITKAQSRLLEGQNPQPTEKISEEIKIVPEQSKNDRLLKTKKKMLNAIGSERMNGVFEGTEPLRSPGQTSSHSPVSGQDPSDAGVDISGLFGTAGQKWQKLK
jgi:hypothetical protein